MRTHIRTCACHSVTTSVYIEAATLFTRLRSDANKQERRERDRILEGEVSRVHGGPVLLVYVGFSVSLSVHLFVFVGWVWVVLSKYGIFFYFTDLFIYLCGLGVGNTMKAWVFSISLSIHLFIYVDWVWVIL